MSKNLEQKLNQEKSDFFSRIKRKILPYVLGATVGLISVFGCDNDRSGWPNRTPTLEYINEVIANEKETISIPVNATDPDGDSLTYRLENAPTEMTINPDNEIEWTPTYADAGHYVPRVVVDDGKGEVAYQDINIEINNVPCYRIAFTSWRDGNTEIYIMNEDGSGQTNLTNNPSYEDDCPCWSPDNTKIAFTSDRDGNGEIYVMNSDGTNQTNLTNNPANDGGPSSWSPNGSEIAFTSNRGGWWEIYKMNANGTNQTNLTNHLSWNASPSWSSDERIAFTSARDGNGEIYIMNADGSGQTNLTNNPSYEDDYPCWSPDGSKIAFTSWRDGNGEIYVMNSDGTNQTNLTNNFSYDKYPSWSHDGSKIAFTSWRDGNGEIYIMNADGSGQTNLTNDYYLYWDGFPSWSPNKE